MQLKHCLETWHHKSMDLLSSWFLKIFSVCLTELCLHGKSFKKVVLPSLPQKTFSSLLRERASDTIFTQNARKQQTGATARPTGRCLFSSKTLLWLIRGLLYFIILDFNAIFLVKSANSCRKGLVWCLDNHPRSHFKCKVFTALWVAHLSQFKPNSHFSVLLGQCTMPVHKKERDVFCTLLLRPSNIHVACTDTSTFMASVQNISPQEEAYSTHCFCSFRKKIPTCSVQGEGGRAVIAPFTLLRQKHWPSATFWQLAVIKLQLARASCA